jgi:hypothetical protein
MNYVIPMAVLLCLVRVLGEDLRAQLAKLGGSEVSTGDEFIVWKGSVPEAGPEYIRELRDVKYNETIFDILTQQFEISKLDEAKEGALIQDVDPAIAPDRRFFPKRGLVVIGATPSDFSLKFSRPASGRF